ncbi:hypothetical protein ABB37_07316 [Leptomonas pyrrhocoris]|uniref:Uncharacterized protein n=1 Tax=Leptomonas pyrrhocoris TaxID=157538 RepID=A0A0M9FVR2_LEPPY|nr:hypothetical protein ABB37_07316 [Leptomonas pyrrhocoris]KPA76937.1 hypothetical protein ABB37_07316 [Leptomonas pyrrhocoris]|eukprot:XP_015655376.1 hypothetical protein ABB37_07316 [Leptomonas pyrrhocoris]
MYVCRCVWLRARRGGVAAAIPARTAPSCCCFQPQHSARFFLLYLFLLHFVFSPHNTIDHCTPVRCCLFACFLPLHRCMQSMAEASGEVHARRGGRRRETETITNVRRCHCTGVSLDADLHKCRRLCFFCFLFLSPVCRLCSFRLFLVLGHALYALDYYCYYCFRILFVCMFLFLAGGGGEGGT